MTDDQLREVIRPLTAAVWWLEYMDRIDGGISLDEVRASQEASDSLTELADVYGLDRVRKLHKELVDAFDADSSLVPHVTIPDSQLNGMGQLPGLLLDPRRN